jgi:hypothetical protein
MKKNYFLTLVLVFGIALTATSQTYGVFTERTTDDALVIDDVNGPGHIYIWEGTLVDYTETAHEGSAVLAYEVTDKGWAGFGIDSDIGIDLSAYSNGYLNFAIKVPSTNVSNITIIVRDKSAIEAKLTSGLESYGMVRDDNWHFISIPVQDIIGSSSINMVNIEASLAFVGDGTISAGDRYAFDDIFYSVSIPTNVSLPGETTSFSVYPNPAGESVTISLGGHASAVSVVDLSGKVVYAASDVAGLDKLSVDVSAWNNGVYMVMVELSNGSKEVKKLMVN